MEQLDHGDPWRSLQEISLILMRLQDRLAHSEGTLDVAQGCVTEECLAGLSHDELLVHARGVQERSGLLSVRIERGIEWWHAMHGELAACVLGAGDPPLKKPPQSVD